MPVVAVIRVLRRAVRPCRAGVADASGDALSGFEAAFEHAGAFLEQARPRLHFGLFRLLHDYSLFVFTRLVSLTMGDFQEEKTHDPASLSNRVGETRSDARPASLPACGKGDLFMSALGWVQDAVKASRFCFELLARDFLDLELSRIRGEFTPVADRWLGEVQRLRGGSLRTVELDNVCCLHSLEYSSNYRDRST